MRNRKVVRIIVYVLVCALLLGCILYFVPWPTRIDAEMTCTEISADGQTLNEGEIHIKGWELHYLFKNNRLVLDPFTLPGDYYPVEFATNVTVSDNIVPRYASGATWAEDYSDITVVVFSFEDGWDTCLIRLDGERYFVCSADETTSVSEILEIHHWMAP